MNQLQPMAQDAKQLQAMQARVTLEGLRPKQSGNVSAKWNAEDIAMAVRDVYDMSEKTMINFIILGDLARAIKDKAPTLMTDHLEFGFSLRQLTPEIKSLFKTWGFEETTYGYIYYFTPPIKWDIKIPVEIHVFRRNYKFFSNPDRGWFGVDDFYIPNPFEGYWKARYIVK